MGGTQPADSARTAIAVPIVGADVPLLTQLHAARAAGADLVELRVDRIGDLAAVADLLARPRPLPVIVTVRSPAEGGAWTGREPDRRAAIVRLAALLASGGARVAPADPPAVRHADFVDVELATWEADEGLRRTLGGLCALRQNTGKMRLILSHHDFAGTPAELAPVFDRLVASPADTIKAVFTASDATDAVRVLAELRRVARQRPAIALAMGEAGLATRVLARKHGALLTFAALAPESASAPGQPAISDLRTRYRWGALGPATRVFGVIGWPVAHSQSPCIHNAAMGHTGIDGVYVPLPVQPGYEAIAAFLDAVAASPELEFAGFSVTIPHKEYVVRWLSERRFGVSALARRAGAVNTLARGPDGTWRGENTDAPGALAALDEGLGGSGSRLEGRRAAVLGAGGAARAVAVGLQDRGCRVIVYNRTRARAAALAEELGCDWREWEERGALEADVVVNCTSVGLWPAVDACPLPEESLRPGMVVLDTVYRPEQTRLLRVAAARGCRVVSGVEMFLHQAAAQFALWHGAAAPIRVMRESLRAGSASGPPAGAG